MTLNFPRMDLFLYIQRILYPQKSFSRFVACAADAGGEQAFPNQKGENFYFRKSDCIFMKSSAPLFRGTATALITPFQKGNPELIDEDAFRMLVRAQCLAGISALIVAGTTGEASALTAKEHIRLITLAKEESLGNIPVIAGCGAPTTARAITLAKEAAEAGADAALVVTPYYNKCSQEGLYRHYTSIADAAACPVILYEVPSRTGMHVALETYIRLSKHENICAVKDATANLERVALLRDAVGSDLTIYAGSDSVIVPMLSVGAAGVISVLSNVCPHAVIAMCNAWFSGDSLYAAQLQCHYAPLIRALFSEVNPIPVKTAMAALGMCADEFRLPLCEMPQEDTKKLLRMIKDI